MSRPRRQAPVLIRAALVLAALAAGLGPWWSSREAATRAFPGFVLPAASPVEDAVPFFQTTVVNPETPQPKAHSATLAELPGGALAVAWYAGTAECAGDVGIFFARREADGSWTPPREILTRDLVISQLNRSVISLGNPLLLSDGSNRLGLLFVSISAGRWSGSSMNLTWSEDGGATWSPAQKLTMNPLANFTSLPRNPPSRLVGGGWAVPVYDEFLGKFPEILWLQPRGSGWSAAVSRIEGGVYILQPSLVPLAAERAVALFRDFRPAQWMSVSWSVDAGRTWTRPVASELPNRDSGVCAVRLSNGSLLCAFNDLSPGKRENLRLALSRDEGRTWRRIATLEEESGQEFSYPSMIIGSDGRVRMVYSARQARIHYTEFSEAWIKQQEAAAR
ncbi:MAG: sialidase family protein [Chthoniobacterales bacterium]